MTSKNGLLGAIQEYSLPLIFGVFAALAAANLFHDQYHHWIHTPLFEGQLLGHDVHLHFLVNDIFMVFFFGIAAKEITDAILPGGALNPPSKAINPLLGTIGGVLGPVGVFLGLVYLFHAGDANYADVANGWGVPTATDIALAWLVARIVFGARHPAVNFLLLLAVADDAIGLGIIAVAYPSPDHPVHVANLVWTLAGMGVAFGLRKAQVQNWLAYIVLGGGLAWYGLITAALHPALALVFIVPFLPAARPGTGLITEEDDTAGDDAHGDGHGHGGDTPLERFEHTLKTPVDYGLFVFAFANAGVEFANMGSLTWIILAALVIGKTLGIFLFSYVGAKIGFPLPEGMDFKTLVTAGLVAGLGLTVALFVSGEAYRDPILQGEAKMGALFSGSVFLVAIVVGRVLKIRRISS